MFVRYMVSMMYVCDTCEVYIGVDDPVTQIAAQFLKLRQMIFK
jgi:hypothetical protein